MTRFIEIKTCSECPHKNASSGFSYEPTQSCTKVRDKGVFKSIPKVWETVNNIPKYSLPIPDWCPLETLPGKM